MLDINERLNNLEARLREVSNAPARRRGAPP